VWLGALRSHQGDNEEAADLIDRAFTERKWLGHPFAAQHGYMFRTLSLGQRGLVVDALRASDEGRADAQAYGEPGARFLYVIDNVHSWLLRGVGRLDEADELSRGVLELTTADGTVSTNEMRHASMLDLIDGRMLSDDLSGATVAMEHAAPVETLHGTMAWHHRQRYWVQQARLFLAQGDLAAARAAASRAVDDAQRRGSRRYELFATIVRARIAAADGEVIDHEAVDAALTGLETCGALEAWLVTAELAAATDVDRWWRDAERRAGGLVAGAREHGEGLRRFVGDRFAALGRT
jgi:hypothetical protein